MLTQEQIEQFHANGFLNGGQLLNDDEVETLRAEVMRAIDERERTDIPQPISLRNMSRDESRSVWQIVNIWEASEPFRQLVGRQDVTTAIAQLTGATELRIWHDQISPRRPWRKAWSLSAPRMTGCTRWMAQPARCAGVSG